MTKLSQSANPFDTVLDAIQSLREDVNALSARLDNTEKTNDSEWLTKKQAANYLQVSTSTIDNMVRAKRLKKRLLGKKSVRFSKSNLDKI